VRNKITASNEREERYSLLTLPPQSWSNNQFSNYYGVSIHVAKKIISTEAQERNITENKTIKRARKNIYGRGHSTDR
jgi:hypothetical protein